jgi:hypothetical protein
MTEVLDISTSSGRRTTSPISVVLWFIYFIILNVLIKDDLIILFILSVVGWVVFDVLFKFTPRLVYMTLLYILEAQVLSPSFEDKLYYPKFVEIPELRETIDFDGKKKKRNRRV